MNASRHAQAAATVSGTLGIICGAGRLPIDVATAARNRGVDVFMLALVGEADREIETFPHAWIRFGEVGRLFKLLGAHDCRDVVIIGRVKRPQLKDIQFDFGAVRVLPRFAAMLVGGDDQVLSKVVGYLNEQGIKVHGAHEVAPEILAPVGNLTRAKASARDLADGELGMSVISALARFDIGQAVVVENARVLAVEAAEGTDAMLARVTDLRLEDVRGGVLVKRSKPGQDMRVDMAAIGTGTIDVAAAAGLGGIVVEAGRTIIVDRAGVIGAADKAGLFVCGIDQPADGDA